MVVGEVVGSSRVMWAVAVGEVVSNGQQVRGWAVAEGGQFPSASYHAGYIDLTTGFPLMVDATDLSLQHAPPSHAALCT